MALVEITDPRDERLADFADLADPATRRRRERDEIFIAEGFVAVRRLAESRHSIRSVLVERARLPRLDDIVEALAATIYVADRDVVEATVGFHMHRGIVAAANRQPLPRITDVLADAARIVVLEGLNDPENLGLIARSARAFGIDAIVLDPTCIDPYYRRSVRVSMGEILLVDVARSADWPRDLDSIRAAGFTTWAMTPAPEADDLWDLDVPERLAIILGAEGSGLTPGAMHRADRRVRIPIDPSVDSINVGHAAAVAFAATNRH